MNNVSLVKEPAMTLQQLPFVAVRFNVHSVVAVCAASAPAA